MTAWLPRFVHRARTVRGDDPVLAWNLYARAVYGGRGWIPQEQEGGKVTWVRF